jgi:hypothetical protein
MRLGSVAVESAVLTIGPAVSSSDSTCRCSLLLLVERLHIVERRWPECKASGSLSGPSASRHAHGGGPVALGPAAAALRRAACHPGG